MAQIENPDWGVDYFATDRRGRPAPARAPPQPVGLIRFRIARRYDASAAKVSTAATTTAAGVTPALTASVARIFWSSGVRLTASRGLVGMDTAYLTSGRLITADFVCRFRFYSTSHMIY